ncbi:RidA family protein [Tropheryma whipplei]|uniref:RidA family protein n=1 Tax=Tropheryma whipplei TaxID=2039 RepID=UPI0004ACC457|nr:RidA family protein [Tropheryma whipplei]
MGNFEEKLQAFGKKLPDLARPVAAYVPAVSCRGFVFTSGQLPFVNGVLQQEGLVADSVSIADARDLAEICALNALSAIKHLIGDLDLISAIVKITGFVASAPGFTGQPQVIDGASCLLSKVFGAGHARSAVGVSALPLNAPVELELIASIVD